jgi:hypothetical protein
MYLRNVPHDNHARLWESRWWERLLEGKGEIEIPPKEHTRQESSPSELATGKSLYQGSVQGSTHIEMSVTVNPPSIELPTTELASLESDIAGVVTVENVAKGRLEVTVMVTKGWLHNVELRIGLSDVDRLNESQLAPVPTKDDVKFIARS